MKILIIGPIPIHLGGKDYGGICMHITDLSNHLTNKKHSITLWNHKPISTNKGVIKVIGNSYFSYIKVFRLFFK